MANKLRKLSKQQNVSQSSGGDDVREVESEAGTGIALLEDDSLPLGEMDDEEEISPSPIYDPHPQEGYQPPTTPDPNTWLYRIPLPRSIADEYESQAATLDIPVENLIARRLIACKSHTSTKPLYITDDERTLLESLFERSLNTSSQLMPLIQRFAEIGIQWPGDPGRVDHEDNPAEFADTLSATPNYTDDYRLTVPLTATMLERIHSRRFDPSLPFESFVTVLFLNLAKRYCGMI